MRQPQQKRPRLRLNLEKYGVLRDQVLRRDGWRGQECGSSKESQVHDLIKRSELGDDVMDNLITLCSSCHRQCHRD